MALRHSFPGTLMVPLLVAAMGCGRADEDGPGCRDDSQCGLGSACVIGACVPRIVGTTAPWSLELVPRADSDWALTEKKAVSFSADAIDLRVESKTRIEGQIMDVDPMLSPATMRVLLSIPSAIGRGDRQFESEARRTAEDMSSLRFSIKVPESAVGQPARVSIFPASPIDQVLPVWTVSLSPLGPSLVLAVPKSNELATIEGILLDATEQPQAGYVARALVGDRLVSNVFKTDAQGRFKLKVPTRPDNKVDFDQVKVELTPGSDDVVKPRMVVPVTAVKLNLGVLRLPARATPMFLSIPVTTNGIARKLPGVTLRFSAELKNASGGTATIVRETQTDKDGVARIALLPGLAGQPMAYSVAVVPPPNSEFASRCLGAYSVVAPMNGQAPTGMPIDLVSKLEVYGVVTDARGMPQAGVRMTATRQAGGDLQDCGIDDSGSPSTMTTGVDGRYRLDLDPGRYRIEYEPPSGSAASLFVEDRVLIDRVLERRVALPGGVVATGSVRTAAGAAVLGCELRVFGVPLDGQRIELRARARTGGDGRFSLVLPQSP